jgi:hypothetical protein
MLGRELGTKEMPQMVMMATFAVLFLHTFVKEWFTCY